MLLRASVPGVRGGPYDVTSDLHLLVEARVAL